jgi:predicted nucleic acid-binding protein
MTLDPASLTRSPRILVLDTSVVLNLLACGATTRVLENIDARFIVPSQVVREVSKEPTGTDLPNGTFADLVQRKLIFEHRLEGDALRTFIDLASAQPPDGLGDGEAATIALAEELACEAVIDERKATRIATLRRPAMSVLSTVDLFHNFHEHSSVERQDVSDCVYNALRNARMRVPSRSGDWVVSLIGIERARECSSLSAVLRARAY